MTTLPETLFRHGPSEHLTVGDDLCIITHSPGASRYADDPAIVRAGSDVRLALPELAGAEPDLAAVLEGTLPSVTIRSVCRSDDPAAPLYVSITVTRGVQPDRGMPALAVRMEDVTPWMMEIQRRAQTTNEAMLLLHAMETSKAYIESILDGMADMLIVTSLEGVIGAVNRAAVELTGHAPEELSGLQITHLIPDEPVPVPLTALVPGPPVERHVGTRGGVMVPVSFSRAPLLDDAAVPRGVVYIGRDLREQKRAEAMISRLETSNLSLREALQSHPGPGGIVWSSPAMGALIRDMERVAGTDTTVLITGETGTGKELIAREIHRLSARHEGIIVTVNCAALPPGLLESELFGHERGAFTGASQRRIGRFELADGGTVFLDEVGELPPTAQATLLRVLQEQTFERVGGSQPIRVNVRVVAATNRILADEVQAGRFRDDLLFRLNVFPLKVPPLRERRDDIPLLASHFIAAFARRTNRSVAGIRPAAVAMLEEYAWPGNVRELANAIERALIVSDGAMLDTHHFALPLSIPAQREAGPHRFDDIAREHVLSALEACDGVIEGPHGAAMRLGLKPATLRSRMKKLGIVRDRGGFRSAPDPREASPQA